MPPTSDSIQASPATLDLSVVVPVFDEEGTVLTLAEQIHQALASSGKSYEIVFVDDGSDDASFDRMREAVKADARVRAVRFRRNFGKAAALTAGFRHARGQVIVTMDADLQDDPAELLRLVGELDRGYDLVSGWKVDRQDPLDKTLPSLVFNRVTGALTRLRLHDMNCGFKAYRREVVQEIRVYGELHRYIPVLAHWRGFRVGEVAVRHHPRRFGKSKYGISRFLKGFVDLLTVMFLTRYTLRPLHLFGAAGTVLAGTGVLINLYLTVLWTLGHGIGHRPLLQLGVLLSVVGLQLIFTGLIGEMVADRGFDPDSIYSVRETL